MPEQDGGVEFYVDGFGFLGSPYTVMVTFNVGQAKGDPMEVVTLRMSPQHAKVMAILFKRNMKAYEEQMGSEIPVSPNTLASLEVDLETEW